MEVPSIVFSFILKGGKVVSVLEHDTIDGARAHLGLCEPFDTSGGTCYYHINPMVGSNLYRDASWVVNYKESRPTIDTLGVNECEQEILYTALIMIIRKNSLKKLLGYENI